MTVSEIRVTRPTPAVAIVTIDRPARRNACNLAAWQGLARNFRELAGERAVRLVILTGAAGHFCAGADISEFATQRADSAGGALYEREVEACYRAIQELPQPSIAAIEGSCVGGGCALALCCDFRVLRRNARFGIPAAKLGTVYTTEECRLLLSIVGIANAKRILFGGELFDAVAAAEMGFADTVVEGDPVAAAIGFGEAMGANAPLAVAGIKRILQELAYGDVKARKSQIAALIREALDSEDYREGAAAFLEKRKANFTGR
ncbi:MAG TPA: enoyl-CoA hydratase-related protein [Stellaceae bacterium]|nr:enoyl-CoA hydratase-related protein [Stellaceae bacterium]